MLRFLYGLSRFNSLKGTAYLLVDGYKKALA